MLFIHIFIKIQTFQQDTLPTFLGKKEAPPEMTFHFRRCFCSYLIFAITENPVFHHLT